MMPAFSTRNSTEPPFAPRTAPATSIVTVPTFGFGIMPRGPSTLPSRPTSGIRSGVAMQRSKSILPPCTIGDKLLRTDDVGAGGLRLFGLGAAREHRDALRAARAIRQRDDAAHHLVGMTRIDAEIHRDLDGLVELRLGALLDELHGLIECVGLLRIDALAGLGDAFACTP